MFGITQNSGFLRSTNQHFSFFALFRLVLLTRRAKLLALPVVLIEPEARWPSALRSRELGRLDVRKAAAPPASPSAYMHVLTLSASEHLPLSPSSSGTSTRSAASGIGGGGGGDGGGGDDDNDGG